MSVGSSKQTLCKLCLNIINDTDFEVIEEIIRGILQVVLPSLDLETKEKHIICRTCHVNLIAAYNFKSMCIDTDDVISSYINPEQIPVVELKDVYLKEKENVQLIDISENQKICRLCFHLVTYGFVSLHEVDVDIINKYIQQANVNATKDPVICGLCFDSLHTHDSFVKNCLDAQGQYIHSYIKAEEINIKVEEDLQDSESSSYNLFEGTIKNNKKKRVSEDKDKCDTCSFKTKYKDVLKRHLLLHRDPSKVQMYKCNACNYRTTMKQHLKKHHLTHKDLSEVQMHKCYVCSYETKYRIDLKRHELLHKDLSEIEMYKCDVCSYEAKRRCHLKAHQLTHKDPSEVKMYKCDVCSFETKYKAYLKTHHLTHKDPSVIQMYKCDSCSFETIYKSGLARHLLNHKDPSRVQIYKCESCSYETKHMRYLKQHNFRKHGNSSKA